MTRPTKERVDELLLDCEHHHGGMYYDLCAEVGALREELASLERSRVREAFALDPAYFREHVPGYDAIMATATYSTEAVDALLKEIDDSEYELREGRAYWTIDRAAEAVRASREPPLKTSEGTST